MQGMFSRGQRRLGNPTDNAVSGGESERVRIWRAPRHAAWGRGVPRVANGRSNLLY